MWEGAGVGWEEESWLLYFSLICNSETVWTIFMKLHRRLKHNIKTMCREQRRQFLPIRFPGHNSTPFRPSVRACVLACYKNIVSGPYGTYSCNFTGDLIISG